MYINVFFNKLFNIRSGSASKCKDATNASSTAGTPNPVVRILMNLNQILEEDGIIEDDAISIISRRESSVSLFPEDSFPNIHRKSDVTMASSSARSSLANQAIDLNQLADEFSQKSSQFGTISAESRRKVVRNCLDLKRVLDKEGGTLYAESYVQKALFPAKSLNNISIFFKCLKATNDAETAVVITNMLTRLVTNTDCNPGNASYMAKKNLVPILLKSLQTYHQEYYAPRSTSVSSNMQQRVDDLVVNYFTLLTKVAKHGKRLNIA